MTTSSTNYTGLYSGNVSGVIPNTAYGNANVVGLLAAGTDGANTVANIIATGNVTSGNLLTPGKISATGNITTAGFFIGTFLGNIVGNLIVPGANTQVLYNNNGNADASSGFTFNQASNLVTVAGNIVGANVSTVGNVTGAYILGNGSQLTGIAAGYSNANVATFLANFGSNVISTTGTVTAGNITGSNILTPGVVSATGNVTGNFFLGNGSQLTGLPATYSNANVATFLANFGSNSISTTGNIAAGYFTGNGSLLTSITGANVTGTVANATFATTAGSAGSANTAVTVTGNAQANITSVGVLTSLSVSGNTTSGNVLTSVVQATNSAGLSLKNSGGTTQASMGAGGGDNFAIAVSTNINGANAQIDISPTGNSGHVHIKPTGTPSVEIAPTYPGSINNMVIGNITPAAVSATTVSATGNITANYFIGNGSQLTGITTSAGGANTQIQFNNGNAFAGNAAMTFDNVTGNVTLANLIIGTGNTSNATTGGNATRLNTSTAWTNMTVTQGNLQAGQIVIGNGFFGNLDLSLAASLAVRGAKASLWDSANVAEAGGATARYAGLVVAPQISIANIANGSTQVRGGVGAIAIGGGGSANIWSATASGPVAVVGWNQTAFIGQPNTVQSLGNVTVSGVTASLSQIVMYNGSNVGNSVSTLAQTNNAGNITSALGVASYFLGTANVTPTNVFGYYMPGTASTYGIASTNTQRAATNYYFLRNDDAVAQNQLGSLRAYHTFQVTGNTTGTWNIDKNNGQVQRVSATGNITIGTYTNFVTTANDGTNNDNQTDTVTLIIEQGATPYTVTMPTGNAAIKYASNVTTVSNVANTTTMIAITAYRTTANAAGYLTTISPAFS